MGGGVNAPGRGVWSGCVLLVNLSGFWNMAISFSMLRRVLVKQKGKEVGRNTTPVTVAEEAINYTCRMLTRPCFAIIADILMSLKLAAS